MSKTIIIKDVITLWTPSLFVAEPFKDGPGDPRWSGTFMVFKDSAQDKEVLAAIDEVGKEAFGTSWAKNWKSWEFDSSKCFYTNGGDRNQEYCHESNIINAHRYPDKGAPAIVNKDRTPITQESGVLYGGCSVNVKFEIWPQVKNYPGIRATLIAVQFISDGEPLGGSGPATAEGFDDLSSDDDMMAGL